MEENEYWKLLSAKMLIHRVNGIWHVKINDEVYFKSRFQLLAMFYVTYVEYKASKAIKTLKKYGLAIKKRNIKHQEEGGQDV